MLPSWSNTHRFPFGDTCSLVKSGTFNKQKWAGDDFIVLYRSLQSNISIAHVRLPDKWRTCSVI